MREGRKWFAGTVWAVLFGVALAALWYGWHAWHCKGRTAMSCNRFGMLLRRHQCNRGTRPFDRIRVGMSSDDTDAIMKECGYEMAGATGMQESRCWCSGSENKYEPLIVLIFGQDGHLKKKELDSTLMEQGLFGEKRY